MSELIDFEQQRLEETYEAIATEIDRLSAPVNAANQRAAQKIRESLDDRRGRFEAAMAADAIVHRGRVDFVDHPEFGNEQFYIAQVSMGRDLPCGAGVVSWEEPFAQEWFFEVDKTNVKAGVGRKRIILGRKRSVESVSDPVLTEAAPHDPGLAAVGSPEATDDVVGVDPLLAALNLAGDGTMRDVVATIEADQYALMALPLDQVLLVKGAPGTGKTVVGLHRIAVQLYRNPKMRAADVLVTGPNAVFLKYAANVLPDLGRGAVNQRAIRTLSGDLSIADMSVEDTDRVRAVKGSARMAKVISSFLDQRVSADDEDLAVGRRRLPRAEVVRLIGNARRRRGGYNERRAAFQKALVEALAHAGGVRPETVVGNNRKELDQAMSRIWPRFSAREVVRRLLQGPNVLAKAAEGILTTEEQTVLLRPATERLGDAVWSVSDVALVDEVVDQLDGVDRVYAHVVVDEAQNVSPMELRMLARRVRGGSLTILGDLAQATEPWAARSWEEHLSGTGIEVGREATLDRCYRIPELLIKPANRLAELRIDADLSLARSVIAGGDSPRYQQVSGDETLEALIECLDEVETLDGTVAIIGLASALATVADGLKSAAVEFAWARDDLEASIVLLPVDDANGLEFENVIVLDPSSILRSDPVTGPRRLFVAMTRPRRRLDVIHSSSLPAVLLPADSQDHVERSSVADQPAAEVRVADPMPAVASSHNQNSSPLTNMTSVQYFKDVSTLIRVATNLATGRLDVERVHPEAAEAAVLAKGVVIEASGRLYALVHLPHSSAPELLDAERLEDLERSILDLVRG